MRFVGCNARFCCEQETTLADLLQLNLHCFEEEVRSIVDKAVKEMAMEKVLLELDSIWTGTNRVALL